MNVSKTMPDRSSCRPGTRADEWAAFLDVACGDDAELRARVDDSSRPTRRWAASSRCAADPRLHRRAPITRSTRAP